MNDPSKITGIACSIFRKEIEFLVQSNKLPDSFNFIDSELHMKPLELDQVLSQVVNPNCLLCYGDCHARTNSSENRIDGLNCIEVFLSKDRYRILRKEGAFFLLPEWTYKWERIFKELLGFNEQKLASQFMNEMHTKFLYINTGVIDIPSSILNDISLYFELPVEVIDVDLIHLENAIKNGLKRLEHEG